VPVVLRFDRLQGQPLVPLGVEGGDPRPRGRLTRGLARDVGRGDQRRVDRERLPADRLIQIVVQIAGDVQPAAASKSARGSVLYATSRSPCN